MKKYTVAKSKIPHLPTFPLKYGDDVIDVAYPENPQENVCDAYGASVIKGEIDTTYMDHWVKSYKANTIRKDPQKALDNLSELCFTCHNVQVNYKRTYGVIHKKNLWRMVKVGLLMPRDMKEKVDWVAKAWLNARRTDKKEKLEDYFK